MQENSKDPAIKLFGKKIPFPGEAENHFIAGDETPLPPSPTAVIEVEDEEREVGETETAESDEEKEIGDKDPQGEKVIEKKKEADDPFPNAAETKNINNNSSIQNPNTPSIEEKTAKSKNAKSENEQQSDSTTNNLQEKTLKKPDKLLPCPRCKSMETKFCYYNNYNVNQPRYFCRACQRYWTAGGTMRNVPVGAGRRKNKNCSLHYRHITISEALQAATIDSPNGTTNHLHFPCLTSNSRVLSFGNEFHSIEETKIQSKGENVEDCSTLSSITVSNSIEESGVNPSKELLQQRNNGFLPQVQSMSSVPWSYPWSSAVPMSFYPTPFWNVPWFPSHPFGPNPISPSSGGSNSPTLGKHSREDDDEDMVKQDDNRKEDSPRQRNGCVLVPKTLRIDDPNEAAKSSIWATLGIKNECMSKRGMINAFQSKKGEKNHVVQTSPMLMANPAALSRSLNFHENS